MIRIVVAEDHKLVRRSIRYLLDASGEIEVVGEAENGADAVSLAEQLKPDLIVMDIAMPRQDGITATKRIQELELPTQVLILSIYDNRALVQQALKSGARGYVLKRALTAELLPAIRQVNQGGTYLSLGLVERRENPPEGGYGIQGQE
jgi:DNA-binding NarL/FixJ family response regulator